MCVCNAAFLSIYIYISILYIYIYIIYIYNVCVCVVCVLRMLMLMCSTVYISSFDAIPSTPGDFVSFIAFFATISGVTINFPK